MQKDKIEKKTSQQKEAQKNKTPTNLGKTIKPYESDYANEIT